jgi:DNA-binding beta-propeller fold protein YncE
VAVRRVRASDGSLVGTWTGATNAFAVLVARGRIYVTGLEGRLYVINPGTAPGSVTTLSSTLDNSPFQIATDGTSMWTANFSGSVSKIDADSGATTKLTAGFSHPGGITFDGTNLWVTDAGDGMLKKLDASGAVMQSVPVGNSPRLPVFDGSNIWVPNSASDTVTVVRARDGQVLATLTGLSMSTPFQAAFDGERILVTNHNGSFLSMWRATDLTPLGTIASGVAAVPTGVCSDGRLCSLTAR